MQGFIHHTWIIHVDTLGDLHFAADGMGSSNFAGGLRKTIFFRKSVRIGRSRSSKVIDFGTYIPIEIERALRDFLFGRHSNFDPLAPFPSYCKFFCS